MYAEFMTDYAVYILASKRRGTLYVGVTNDLARRIHEHHTGVAEGFTKQYAVYRLVYLETTTEVQSAIEREKQLKHWKRDWKIALIEQANPEWTDLAVS